MPLFASRTKGPNLDQLLALLEEILPGDQYQMLEASLSLVARRMLEVVVLRDSRLYEIAKFRDVYAGRASQLIASRLSSLGLSQYVDDTDIRHVKRILLEGSQGTTKEPVSAESEYSLFRELYLGGASELRCALCGYHFVEADMSDHRRDLASQFELMLARRKRPKRMSDGLKNPEMTELNIDHVIPRAGWGPTRTDNLQFLCKYCNSGKSAYRWWGELTPVAMSASLPTIPGDGYAWQIRSSFVATLMRDGSICVACGQASCEVELSVLQAEEWIVPMTLHTRCYDCL